LNEANWMNHRVKTLVHELSHALLRAERADTDLPFGYCEEEWSWSRSPTRCAAA
jgi:hypothetical protein